MGLLKTLLKLIGTLLNSKHVDEYAKENLDNEKPLVVMPPKFKNESDRLKSEFTELLNKSPKLHDLILDLNKKTQDEFKKRLTITMIYRTQAEQDYLYMNSERYKKRKFKSPHQFWTAVDIRSRNFTESEVQILVDYLNSKYDGINQYKWTAKNHTVGHGMHFHIQLTTS